MVEQIGSTERKLHVVGNPRVDILGDNLNKFYEREEKQYEKEFGDYVLVNISFCIGLTAQDIIKTVEGHSNRKMAEQEKNSIQKQYEFLNKTFNILCNGIVEMTKNIDNIIIVRPHPSEPAFEKWVDRFKDCERVFVIRTGDANSWIGRAEILIHTGCTTAFEAYVSGKPTVLFNPFEEIDIPLLSDIGVRAENEKKLVEIVKNYLDSHDMTKFINDNSEESIKRFVSIDKKKYSCEKIADLIEQNKFADDSIKIRKCLKLHDIKHELTVIKLAVLDKKAQPKFGYTKCGEIKQNIRAANKILGYNFSIRVKKINSNVFVCKRDKNQ